MAMNDFFMTVNDFECPFGIFLTRAHVTYFASDKELYLLGIAIKAIHWIG
jgi:hypothetical protein